MAVLDDDSIIELTDIVSNDSDMSTLEDVIELTDIVKDKKNNLELGDVDKFDLEIDDQKYDKILGENVEGDEDFEAIGLEQLDGNEEDDALIYDELTEGDNLIQDDVQENIVEDEPQVIPKMESTLPDNFNIDQEQIETILERIIEKKFADKIESILFKVMENVIEKQIIEIKDSLQKDLDDISKN